MAVLHLIPADGGPPYTWVSIPRRTNPRPSPSRPSVETGTAGKRAPGRRSGTVTSGSPGVEEDSGNPQGIKKRYRGKISPGTGCFRGQKKEV